MEQTAVIETLSYGDASAGWCAMIGSDTTPGGQGTQPAAREMSGLRVVNEQAHGIADSLISVLAHRSQDITSDLIDRRSVTDVVAAVRSA